MILSNPILLLLCSQKSRLSVSGIWAFKLYRKSAESYKQAAVKWQKLTQKSCKSTGKAEIPFILK